MSLPPSVIRRCNNPCEDPECCGSEVKNAVAVVLEQCGDSEPLQVEITNPTPDVEKITYCNEDTDTQWVKTCTYKFDADGNTIEEIIGVPMDLGISCSEPVPDIEKNEYCSADTDTIWIEECFYQTEDGVVTKSVLDNYDTGRPCTKEGTPQCRKWQTLAVGIDNNAVKGFVRYQWDSDIELTMSDGSTVVFTQTATTGWTAQITQWANTLQGIFPNAVVDPRCNIAGGCGGLLGPVSDAPLNMYARYVHMSFCPTDIYPVSAKVIAGDGVGVLPLLDWNLTPEKRGYVCMDCEDGAGELKYEDGTPVPAADLPACTFECAETIPVPPESTVEILQGCDDGTDPVTDVIAILDTATNEIGYFTVDADGGLEDYTLVGTFLLDCLEPLPVEPGEVIKVETLCSPATETTTEASFIGSAADGTNGYVATGWEAALAGQTIDLVVPSPTGGTTNWTDGNVLVEQVDYVTPQTPLAGLTRRNITIESPASQGGASAAGAGFDNTSGSSLNINAFLISLTTPVGAMGANFLDTESDINFAEACMELYDASETLLATIPFTYPGGEDGGGEVHFAGFTRASNDVSYILVKTGATAAMTNENSNRLAFGDLRLVELADQQYEVITSVSSDGQTLTCAVYDADKNLVDIDPATLVSCEPEEGSTLDDFKTTCSVAISGLPTVINASGLDSSLNLNQTGTGVSVWNDEADIFDGDFTNFALASIDNQDGQSNGLNAQTFTFDMGEIPECATIDGDVTIKVHADMIDRIGDGGYDAIWASFTGASGALPITSVAAGVQGAPYGNAYVYMGTPDNTYIVSEGLGPVGGATYYEFTVAATLADILAGGVQIGVDNDEPNVDGGKPGLAGIELEVNWITENCEETEGGCALRTKGCNDNRRDDLLLEIAANTAPVEDCAVEVTSEPQCLDGDQTVDMQDGSTRILTDGSYITIVQFFDCNGTLVNILYYETANPDVAIDSIPVTANCDPQPVVSERCITDANGVQWIVTEYRDDNGIILGTPFYVSDTGEIGIPAGSQKEWTSCEGVEIIAVEEKCDQTEYVTINGTNYYAQACGSFGIKYVDIASDVAYIDEQTIVGGWSFVVDSAIDPINCSVEAASVLPGAPDIGTLTIVNEVVEFERIKERNPDGSLTYRDVIEDGNGNLIPYAPFGKVGNCTALAIRDLIGTDADECPCEDEQEVKICVDLFDYDRGLVTVGDTSALRVFLDSAVQSTTVHDYTTTSNGTDVSTYYDPFVAAVNAVPGWSMTLVTDVLQTAQGKPTWDIAFTGTGPSELRLEYASSVGSLGSSDAFIFSVDASGVMTTSVEDGGSPAPDFNSPVFGNC